LVILVVLVRRAVTLVFKSLDLTARRRMRSKPLVILVITLGVQTHVLLYIKNLFKIIPH
jgi:hypothetical protein